MTTLHALRHVSSAVHHAEGLADEADDLGALELAARLRRKAADIAADLDEAVLAIDDIEPQRDARDRAHDVLAAVYVEGTLELERLLPADTAARLSPGGHVDVAERARFRLRHLPDDERLLDVRAALARALFTYDACIDGFLLAFASAQSKKDRAVVKSQALRVELERAKLALLVRADPDSDAWRRIKRRTVRTKRARWIDDAKAQRLLDDAVSSAA